MAARRCSDFTLEAIGDQPAFAEKIMTSRPSRSNLRSSVIPNFSITRADARFLQVFTIYCGTERSESQPRNCWMVPSVSGTISSSANQPSTAES